MVRIALIIFSVVLSTSIYAGQVDTLKNKYLSNVSLQAPIYPSWVHTHWVWENAGTQESAMQLVEDYLRRNIPVGTVIIDRPWDTEPNSFIPSPILYPDLGAYIEKFHDMNVRVVMWVTSIINQGAETFQEAKDKGYLWKGKTDLEWWAGVGGLLDYANPEALNWWHRQMDRILDLNIDGWKVDATDPVILTASKLTEALDNWNDYKKLEYGDFFHYTRQRLGNDRVIMARPVDDYIGLGLPVTFAKPEISYAAWVGDQDGNWRGLKHALVNMLASAELDYPVIGSDIGGFRNDGDSPMRDKKLFVRWTQLGALMPLMENGGGGEHRPWMYDAEVESIYRKYTHLHDNLLPYIYSQTAVAIQSRKSPVKTTGNNYRYYLGDSVVVSPLYTDNDRLQVCLPSGNWKYIGNEAKTLKGCRGPQTFSLSEYPVYFKVGSLIPMNVVNAETGFGAEASKDHLTVVLYPNALKSAETAEQIVPVYTDNRDAGLLSYTQTASTLTLESSSIHKPILYRIYGYKGTVRTLEGQAIPQAADFADLAKQPLATWTGGDITWVKTPASGGAVINR